MILSAVIQWAARLVRRTRPAAVACAVTVPPRPRRRGRWTPYDHSDPTGSCPCDDCAWARAHPMEERPPCRPGRPLTARQIEQERIHEEHLARELAMYAALVWAPEIRAEQTKVLSLALLRVRAEQLAAKLRWFLSSLTELHQGPSLALALDHVTAAPRTGPPAAAVADCTGGVVFVP